MISLAAIDHGVNVIKRDLELASAVAMQWFVDNFMKANASKFHALCDNFLIQVHLMYRRKVIK